MADKDFVVKNGLIVGDTATINGVQIDPYGATSGQVLKFDGTKFAPATDEGATQTASYAETIGDGTNSTYTVTHNLNTKDISVTIRDANSPYDVVQARWEATTNNSITIDFSTIISSSSRRVFIASAGSLDYYVATIGDGSLTTINLDHNLGSRDVFVTVRNASSPYESIIVGAAAPTLQRIALDFSSAPEANSLVASVYLPSEGASFSSKIGDGSTSTFTLTHNLNTRDIGIIVRSVASPYDFIPVRWEASTANTATIYFESSPATDSRKVTVFSGVGGIKDFNDEVGLSDLDDVVLTSISSGQFLSWDGTSWINSNAPGAISNTDSLTEGVVNLYFSNARARSAISVSGDLSYNSNTGVISFTNDVGDIESITAGTGLSGGGSSGSVTLNLASTAVSAGTYGNSSTVATFTVDAQGRLTSASNSSISIAASQISDLSSNTVVSIAGTANEVEVSASTGSVTIGLPANVTISQDLIVTGNLTVSGNTTTINTETLLIEDNVIVLNSGHTGSPTTNAGLMVERGTSADVEIRWDESVDKWQVTNDGTTYGNIATGQTVDTTSSVTFANATISGHLSVTAASGDEGGEILLAKPATNTSIAGTGVTIDVYRNKLRIFEQGGNARGAFVDLTTTADGVANPIVLSQSTGNSTSPVLSSLIVNGSTKVTSMLEIASVSATAATGTINVDFISNPIVYYTSNATANWTLNIRGNSTTTMNTVMSTGDIATITFMAQQGATAYYPTTYQVDGVSITPKWQGGTAPSSGNASSIDLYSLSIIKTAANTYTMFASQTKFA